MRIVLSLIFVAFFSLHEISAQFNYHRTYPVSGRSELAIGMAQASDGYYTYNGVVDLGIGLITALNVSKFDPKGEVTWSKDITLEGNPGSLLDGEIEVLQDDSIAITILISPQEGLENVNVVMKLDRNGDIEWVKGLGGFDGFVPNGTAYPLTQSIRDDFGIVIATTYTLSDEFGLTCVHLDQEGEVIWSNRTQMLDTLGIEIQPFVFGSSMVEDSAFIAGGYGSDLATFIDGLMVKIDSVGTPLWAKSYTDSIGGFNLGNDLLMLSDTSYILAGLNQNPLLGSVRGFVMKTDRDGNLLWSKQMEIGFAGFGTTIDHVVETENGDIVVVGVLSNDFNNGGFPFKAKLNADGDYLWGKLYNRTVGWQAGVGELLPIAENGTAYWGTEFDQGNFNSQLIVADSIGNAGAMMADVIDQCAQDLPDSLLVDWPTGMMDLSITTVTDTATVDYVAQSVGRAIGFDIPVVSLVDTAFCPNDPIFVIEDAFVEGADSYLWNTEETTPSIEVEEEGNPIVEVTINDERGCFTLCDTATISVLDSTMVFLQLDDSAWCENREITVIANPSGGLPPYDIDWSTGDTIPSITVVVEEGESFTYTVDVIEQCEILASASIDVSPPDIDPADFTLAWNRDRYCAEGVIELQLYDGIFTDIKWYDANGNELPLDGPNPVVSEFGTYSFTALDTCMLEISDEITVPLNLPDPQEIMIDFDVDRACATGELRLEINGPVGDDLSNIRWMDAAGNVIGNNLSVTVPDYGTYSVVATDACQYEIDDEITIGLDNLPTIDLMVVADDTISCSTGLLRIAIENTESLSNIVWSSGQTNTFEIFVDDFDAEYSATADFCQQNYTSNTVSPDISTDNFVRWPNAFYPSFDAEMDTDEFNNRFFGPYIICPPAVEDYELRIYNQYGNLMFETNDPTEFWDGTKDGNLAPGDVYVWYSTYQVSSVTEEINGTATLIR